MVTMGEIFSALEHEIIDAENDIGILEVEINLHKKAVSWNEGRIDLAEYMKDRILGDTLE